MVLTYSEKLRDPRWQRLRLEVMNRDVWACRACGREDLTLHVHHLEYTGSEPWETPSEKLTTLCEDCHDWVERSFDAFGRRRTDPMLIRFVLSITSVVNRPIEKLDAEIARGIAEAFEQELQQQQNYVRTDI